MELMTDTYMRESIEEAPESVLKNISIRVDMKSGKHWIFEGFLGEKSKTAWIFGPKNYITVDLEKRDPKEWDLEIMAVVNFGFEKLTGIEADFD